MRGHPVNDHPIEGSRLDRNPQEVSSIRTFWLQLLCLTLTFNRARSACAQCSLLGGTVSWDAAAQIACVCTERLLRQQLLLEASSDAGIWCLVCRPNAGIECRHFVLCGVREPRRYVWRRSDRVYCLIRLSGYNYYDFILL